MSSPNGRSTDTRQPLPGDPQCQRRPACDATRRCLLVILLIGGLSLDSAFAAPLGESTRQLLIEAIEAAHALDLYHARCRRDSSYRRTENLNKLLASRLRTTVIRVQDELFPERSYRRVQERLERDVLDLLRERGGCDGVKDSDLPAEMRARYDEKIRAIESLP